MSVFSQHMILCILFLPGYLTEMFVELDNVHGVIPQTKCYSIIKCNTIGNNFNYLNVLNIL